ncbi:MAG: flavoprotein [Thermoflexales bacterium]
MRTIYLMISGAITAHRASEIAAALSAHDERLIAVQTPNAIKLISPTTLARIERVELVESYFDPRIRPRPPRGSVLFAPCSFNSLNKLAAGIADNLALSITAEMLGFGERVVVGISMNEPLFNHPATQRAIATLQSWGVQVVPPRDTGSGLMLAPTEELIAALMRRE